MYCMMLVPEFLLNFQYPTVSAVGFPLTPLWKRGGKGGLLKLIDLSKDTPLSLRRGVFIKAFGADGERKNRKVI